MTRKINRNHILELVIDTRVAPARYPGQNKETKYEEEYHYRIREGEGPEEDAD